MGSMPICVQALRNYSTRSIVQSRVSFMSITILAMINPLLQFALRFFASGSYHIGQGLRCWVLFHSAQPAELSDYQSPVTMGLDTTDLPRFFVFQEASFIAIRFSCC